MPRTRRRMLAVAWLLLPLALIALCSGHFELRGLPREMWWLASGALAAVALARRGPLQLRLWHVGLAAALVLDLACVPRNRGMYLERVSATAALFAIALWLDRDQITLRRVRTLLAWPVTAVILGSLVGIFFHANPFGNTDVLGSLLNYRNWVSLFLIAALPWCLMSRTRRAHLATVAIVFICIAARTRTTWLVLALYLAVLAAASLERPLLRPTVRRLAATSAIAIALVAVLPQRLVWNESRPYLTSLTSFTSPDKWHGRADVWRVALEMIRRHPIAGVGTGQFRVAFGEHMLLAHETKISDPVFPFAMDDYLEAGAERGVAGALLWLCLLAGWPVILLVRGLRAPGRRGRFYVLAALPLLGLAVAAFGDSPMNHTETVALFVCTLAPLQRRLAPVVARASRRLTRVACGAIVLVCGLVFALHLTSALATLRYWQTSKPADLELAYQLWPWGVIQEHHPISAMLDDYLSHRRDADAEAFTRSRERNWPDAPTTSLATVVWAKHTGHFDDALASIGRQLQLNAYCAGEAWQVYHALVAEPDFPAGRKLPADVVQPCVGDWSIPEHPEVEWGQAQSELEDWNGTAVFSASWSGSYRPYRVDGDRIVPIIDPGGPTARSIPPELQLMSPLALSDHELVFDVLDGAYSNAFDLGIFDQTANTFTNLTKTPNHSEGEACVDRARRRIGYRFDESERVLDLGPPQRVVMTFPQAFSQCLFDDRGTLYGVQDDPSGRAVWQCGADLRGCGRLPEANGARSIGRLAARDGRVTVSLTRAGDEFRRIYYITDTGALELVPGIAAGDVDVLELVGTEARIDHESRFELVAPDHHSDASAATIYTSRMIGGTRYAIYADTQRLRTIARRDPSGWTLLERREPAHAAEPVEVWLPLPRGRVQAFYFGPPDADHVVLWWHGGPRDNMSPRFEPYFAELNRAGYGVLAVNYPGSSGRGASFEAAFTPAYLVQTLDAVMAYLAAHHVRVVVSWSNSTGSAVQDIVLEHKTPVTAIIDQAGSRAEARRRAAAAQNIPYLTIHGQFDLGGDARHDILYPGGHNLMRYSDFVRMMTEVKAFLRSADRP